MHGKTLGLYADIWIEPIDVGASVARFEYHMVDHQS